MNEFTAPLPVIGDYTLRYQVGALGARGIRLSVIEPNTQALAFWQRLGFIKIERLPPRRLGAKESATLLLRRPLAG